MNVACYTKILSDAPDMAEKGKVTPSTVGISPEARKKLSAYCERKQGANSKDVVTALVEWFLKQPAFVRSVVMQDIDEGLEDAYVHALRQLADNIEQAAKGGGLIPNGTAPFGIQGMPGAKTPSQSPAPDANESAKPPK